MYQTVENLMGIFKYLKNKKNTTTKNIFTNCFYFSV